MMNFNEIQNGGKGFCYKENKENRTTSTKDQLGRYKIM